jgi:hypothetical protein
LKQPELFHKNLLWSFRPLQASKVPRLVGNNPTTQEHPGSEGAFLSEGSGAGSLCDSPCGRPLPRPCPAPPLLPPPGSRALGCNCSRRQRQRFSLCSTRTTAHPDPGPLSVVTHRLAGDMRVAGALLPLLMQACWVATQEVPGTSKAIAFQGEWTPVFLLLGGMPGSRGDLSPPTVRAKDKGLCWGLRFPYLVPCPRTAGASGFPPQQGPWLLSLRASPFSGGVRLGNLGETRW